MSEFLQRFESEIQFRKLFPRRQKILAGVSGGLDSMVLLHALNSLAQNNHWEISVAHFNHQLRGHSSDADEKLVRKIADALKLPFVAERADVKQFARQSKLSIEMAARKLRHEFFARAARKQKIKTIALAHHAGDQVELFFLRLLRGAGGAGLAGMKWRSPSPADKAIALIRPLLDFSKSELAAFARENKIRFRNDATNFSSDFLRNRIRNELLPLLRKKYQRGLDKTVLRLMEITGAESDFIGETTRQWFRSSGWKSAHSKKSQSLLTSAATIWKASFENLSAAIQRRVLQLRLAERGVAADFDLVESLRQSPNQFVSVGSKISASRNRKGEVVLRTEQISKFTENELAVKLGGAVETIFGGVKFSWQIEDGTIFTARIGSRGRPPHQIQKEFFDADKIGGDIILRHWRAGDRFQPIGLKSAAKLQDLFTNTKVPRERKHDLILATTVRGEIFWVEGLRISENFKLTPRTKRCFIWSWRRG